MPRHEFRKAGIQLGMSRVQHSSTPNCSSLLPSSCADRSAVVDFLGRPKTQIQNQDTGPKMLQDGKGHWQMTWQQAPPWWSFIMSNRFIPSRSFRPVQEYLGKSSKNTHGFFKGRFLKNDHQNDVFFISGSFMAVYTIANGQLLRPYGSSGGSGGGGNGGASYPYE